MKSEEMEDRLKIIYSILKKTEIRMNKIKKSRVNASRKNLRGFISGMSVVKILLDYTSEFKEDVLKRSKTR